MKQLQHSYYFWKTPRKNKTTCKNPLFLNDFAHTLMSNICKVLVMAMNTVFLHLSEEAIKRLNKLRGWRKVSRSAILREAVEQYLERQQFPVRKAKGGRQKGEVVGVDDQCKEHKE